MASPRARPGHRHEIQGLRGVALLLVLVFHLWPSALPGGFTGVDVFFVISGWLIVGSLVAAQSEPLVGAAEARGDIGVVDLNNQIWTDLGCTYVRGDVIVYRDDHLTATDTAATADRFAATLEAALDDLGVPPVATAPATPAPTPRATTASSTAPSMAPEAA